MYIDNVYLEELENRVKKLEKTLDRYEYSYSTHSLYHYYKKEFEELKTNQEILYRNLKILGDIMIPNYFNLKSVLLKHLQECGDPLWEQLDGVHDDNSKPSEPFNQDLYNVGYLAGYKEASTEFFDDLEFYEYPWTHEMKNAYIKHLLKKWQKELKGKVIWSGGI